MPAVMRSTLQLLGRFIVDAYPHDRDIRHYKQVKLAEADRERHGRSAFKVMIAYEKWLASGGQEQQRELAILRLTGLFDRPISADCLSALCAEPAIPGLTDAIVTLNQKQWNIALQRLVEVDLLSRTGPGPDAAIDASPAGAGVLRGAIAARLARGLSLGPLTAVRSSVRKHRVPARYARWPATALRGRRSRLLRRATAGGVRRRLR